MVEQIIYLIGEGGQLVKVIIFKHYFSILRSVLAKIYGDTLQTVGSVYSLIDIRCRSSHKCTIRIHHFFFLADFHEPLCKKTYFIQRGWDGKSAIHQLGNIAALGDVNCIFIKYFAPVKVIIYFAHRPGKHHICFFA